LDIVVNARRGIWDVELSFGLGRFQLAEFVDERVREANLLEHLVLMANIDQNIIRVNISGQIVLVVIIQTEQTVSLAGESQKFRLCTFA